MGTTDRKGSMLVQKMFELETAYRQISEKDREIIKYRQTTDSANRDDEREREILKLNYMVQKLEERMKVAKVETENAKRELKNEQEGRKVVDKKLKALEKDNKDLRNKMSSLRVKLGVSNANYNVGKHETEQLRKNHQDDQIQIARLEERLAAANQEKERLRNPQNPDGSHEVQKKIDTDRKEVKKLKEKIEKLKGLREVDQQRIEEKEEENRMMAAELNRCRMTIANLETSLELAEMNIQAERISREEFEKQNEQLLKEKENFDAQIQHYKVKMGISQATKNVSVRQVDFLKKKDEEYQYSIQTLERKLRAANAEIERLKTRYMMTGKTADSLQDHRKRFRKHRNNFNMEFITPRSYDKPGISGWSPASTGTQADRVSLNSIGSRKSPKQEPAHAKPNSGKRGRTSAP